MSEGGGEITIESCGTFEESAITPEIISAEDSTEITLDQDLLYESDLLTSLNAWISGQTDSTDYKKWKLSSDGKVVLE